MFITSVLFIIFNINICIHIFAKINIHLATRFNLLIISKWVASKYNFIKTSNHKYSTHLFNHFNGGDDVADTKRLLCSRRRRRRRPHNNELLRDVLWLSSGCDKKGKNVATLKS